MKKVGRLLQVWVGMCVCAAVVVASLGLLVWVVWPEVIIRPGKRSVESHYSPFIAAYCPAETLKRRGGRPDRQNPIVCTMRAGDPVEAVSVEDDEVIVRVLAERAPGSDGRLCPAGCLYIMSKASFFWGPTWHESRQAEEAAERRAREKARRLVQPPEQPDP